ncbi:MAG: GspMb/PilO family protein [Kiritimatiellaeota bacterium]|nr:GspMb/PilO family protein [Kiritimatiellota bacterium]
MSRNWSSLTKEQKQIVALIGFGVLIVIALLYQFALTPLLESGDSRQQKMTKLQDDIALADKALQREMREHIEYIALTNQLAELTQTAVAPYGRAFAWVTEQLYQVAKEAGVELGGLSGSGQAFGTPDSSGRTFTTFNAQMTVQCSYADLLRFLRLLDEKNPLVTVINLTVDGREQSPERHQVSLALEWPAWAQPPAAPVGKQTKP